MGRVKVERYCTCGAELIIEASDLKAVQIGDQRFGEIHSGEGHRPATRREAARARRRQLLRDAEELGHRER